MKTIHLLPPTIIAHIAAGEVIERPAYAVKELVENAIDAQADRIHIFVEDAGLKRILVKDNGIGMNREDLLECYKHHTTSKISVSKDLVGIKTLGFRGEALSSICSVGDVTIKSKPANAPAGNFISVNNGILQATGVTGMPQGTQIRVENIFSSLPARKKFLKSPRTELRLITDVILPMTLAYPAVSFEFVNNDRVIFDFPKRMETSERIKQLVGLDVFSQMLPLQYQTDHAVISGYISTPHLTASSANRQYFFVNQRHITDTFISKLLKEAYGRILNASAHPLAILFLELPHDMVDVNVHPRKEQVSFINQDDIHELLSVAIQQTLKQADTGHTLWNSPLFTPTSMPQTVTALLKDEARSWASLTLGKDVPTPEIFQIHHRYLITQTHNGIAVIDQHAAHERILYEKFLQEFIKQKKRTTPYELPHSCVLHLSLNQYELLLEQKHFLENVGFVFEAFGRTTVKITHVPALFKEYDLSQLIIELCDQKLFQQNEKSLDRQSERMLSFLACRSAVKAGDSLEVKQRIELIKELETTPNNATCPHGRPTRTEITLRQMDRLFKRS